MPSLSSVILLAGLAPLALAAPTSNNNNVQRAEPIQKRSFTVPQVRIDTGRVRNGKKDLAKVYAKYGFAQPGSKKSESKADFNADSNSSGNSDDSSSSSSLESLFPWLFGNGGNGGGNNNNGGSSASTSTVATVAATSTAAISTAATSTAATSTAATSTAATSTAASADSDARKTTTSTTAAASATSTAVDASGETGETTATAAEADAEFIELITIGGKAFHMDFDTGSADLWVYDSSIAGSHASIDTTDSTFWTEESGLSFEISYGDGSGASGVVGTAVVAVGSATVTKQAVEVATSASSEFTSDSSSDGLLGLGFSTLNSVEPTQQKTFFANIQDSLESPLFTVYLNESGSGEYEFGAIDASKYTGDLYYTDINSEQGYWQFTSTSYQVAGTTGSNTDASPAIADTGTSLILTDDAVVEAYYAQVSGAENSDEEGGYIFPCDADLPTFAVEIGSTGYYASVPGYLVNYAAAGDNTCYGGIQSNSGEGLQIFGDVLLRNHFVVFNGETPSIAFADKPST